MRFASKSLSAAAALLLVAALGVPAAAAGEATDRRIVPPAVAPALEEAVAGVSTVWQESIRLRGELGFSLTPSALAAALPAGVALADDKRLYQFVNNWGFIGTAAEAAEMARREALVTDLLPTLDKLAGQAGYAGHFLDNARGGVLVVQFAGGIPVGAEAELAKHIPAAGGSTPRNIELRTVKVSSSQLTAAIRALWDTHPEYLVAVAEDVSNNGLDITLSQQATDKDRLAIQSGLSVPVSFGTGKGQDEACTSRSQCNSPQRGGVALDAEQPCSAGWVVQTGEAAGVLTAGHCWWGSNSGTVTSGSAGTFGHKTSLNALSPGTHADMRYLAAGDPRAWLYEDNTDRQRVVTGSNLGAVGLTACLYARSSATPRCGTIKSTNASHKSSTTGFTVYGQSSATYGSSSGDSGGAVASGTVGNIARGVHVASPGGGVKHYSWIGYSSMYGLGQLMTG
ncbi:MAG: hypothetical protein ACT4QG_13130 [Sporichthyaceae bacterium]